MAGFGGLRAGSEETQSISDSQPGPPIGEFHQVRILTAAFAGSEVSGRRIIAAVIQGLQDLAEVFGIADVVRPPK